MALGALSTLFIWSTKIRFSLVLCEVFLLHFFSSLEGVVFCYPFCTEPLHSLGLRELLEVDERSPASPSVARVLAWPSKWLRMWGLEPVSQASDMNSTSIGAVPEEANPADPPRW